MREKLDRKQKVINQWWDNSITKSHQLSSYHGEIQDWYDLDYTANTNNSEGIIFVFIADTTEYDTSASVNSNEEIEGTPNFCELTVNTATLKSML